MDDRTDRERRLAEALRANLHRRKTQSRAQRRPDSAATDAESPDQPDVGAGGDGREVRPG